MIIEIKQCNWDTEIKCINVLMLLTLYHVVSRDNRRHYWGAVSIEGVTGGVVS